jgi:hypothetical protein
MTQSDFEPDAATKAAAVEMIMAGLAKAEIEFASSVCVPFFWALRGSRGEQLKSGSAFFLDTGERLFAVTACHVVEECLADSRSPTFIQCMIGGPGSTLPLYLGDRIIDANHDLDIATFHVTSEEVSRLGMTPLRGYVNQWPPRLCEVDGPVTYCGYPGHARKVLAPRELSWGTFAAGGIVTSANEISISVQIDRANLRQVLGEGSFMENYDFGGTSGGPLIAIVQTNTFRSWKPAGVVIQGPNPIVDDTQSIQGLEIVKARPIDFILADGYLDNSRWAMNNIQREATKGR